MSFCLYSNSRILTLFSLRHSSVHLLSVDRVTCSLRSTSNFKLIQSNVLTGTLMNGYGHKLSACRTHYASVFVFLCTHLLLSISSYLHNLFPNISKQALPISRACFIMHNSTARGNNTNPKAAPALVCNYKQEYKLHFTSFPKSFCSQES